MTYQAKSPDEIFAIAEEFYSDYELRKIDGHDDAIIGLVNRFGMEHPVICYSRKKIIETLVFRDKMSYDEAREFFDFNIAGAFVGEGTPAYLEDD